MFGALSLLLASQITRINALSIGVLLGLSFLTRFENLLLIATGSLMILWYSRDRIIHFILYCIGWLPFVGGWGWLLYKETGRFTLSPRYWEPWIIPLIDEMPLRWVQELYGMGIWNPPLRQLALESQIHPTKQNSTQFIFLDRLDSLARYEYPQSLCTTGRPGLCRQSHPVVQRAFYA